MHAWSWPHTWTDSSNWLIMPWHACSLPWEIFEHYCVGQHAASTVEVFRVQLGGVFTVISSIICPLIFGPPVGKCFFCHYFMFAVLYIHPCVTMLVWSSAQLLYA